MRECTVERGNEEAPTVEVAVVAPAAADDAEFVAQVVGLVNRVYADAERGLWQDNAARTSRDDIAAIVRAGQLAVARLGGRVVGAIHIQRIGDDLGEAGMLVAGPEHRSVGIGRMLLAFAEDWARQRGLRRMQLELLVPRTWTHPVKEFLRGWYTRAGYRPVRTGRFADAYPHLQPQLATPCDFVIFHKILAAPEPAARR
jgi:GNAT superfamily N-acetyltransferase